MKKTDMKKFVRIWSRCAGFELCLCADRQRAEEQRAAVGIVDMAIAIPITKAPVKMVCRR